jgi:hypothetical protein
MQSLHFSALCALLSTLASAQHQTLPAPPLVAGTLPYSITLREVSLAPAPIPTLHSVAAAKWDGQWILLAGRTAGLHGLTGQNAFDPQFENRSVWIIDPVNRLSWSKSLLETNPASGLSADVVDSLSSVNTQFHQTGERLIVVGGYGYKRSAVDHKTYDTLTFIDLPGLVEWVKQPAGSETSQAKDHILQSSDDYFQVTGGSLEKLHGEYQLVIGHIFGGIIADAGNGGNTGASGRVFEVVITPAAHAPVPGIAPDGADVALTWPGNANWGYSSKPAPTCKTGNSPPTRSTAATGR